MSQILLIESNSDLSKVIKLNLMKGYELEVIEKSHIEEAIDLIEMLPDIGIVIVRETPETIVQIKELGMFLKGHKSTIPLILIGENKTGYANEIIISPSNSWKVLIDVVGKSAGKEIRVNFSNSNSEFIPIPITYFFNINESSLGCDIFIRVKKTENEFQYIKRLNSNDNFDRQDIERYQKQGLKDFYITKEHFPQFVNYVTDQLVMQLGNANNLNPEVRLQLSSDVYDVSVDRIKSLGIDEQTIELVQENLKVMSASIGDKNALADYLKSLKQNKMSYAYSHSYLTCLLLNKILKSFEWESASVREKIMFICYFHDISLGNDKMVKVSSLEELEAGHFNSSDQKSILEHANKSAEIIDQFPQVPIGVSALIREHHGVKAGYGFRESLSINLSPISMMFIVVEDFVNEFLKISETPTREQINTIFISLEKVYNKVTYAQTLIALQNAISNNK